MKNYKLIVAILIALLGGILLISKLYDKSDIQVEEETTTTEEVVPTNTTTTTTTNTTTTTKKTTKKTTRKTTKKVSSSWNPSTASRNEYIEYARQKSGYNDTQMQCLIWLWDRESGWNPKSWNKQSTACGIPQACPCSKTNNAYKTDWKAQIDWGIDYINNKYRTPCAAWNHFKNSKPHSY